VIYFTQKRRIGIYIEEKEKQKKERKKKEGDVYFSLKVMKSLLADKVIIHVSVK
jgi:hypothetical protein